MLQSIIENLKGIGNSRAQLFHNLNIFTIKDLLYHIPNRWEDRSATKPSCFTIHGETIALEGTVKKRKINHPRKGLTISTLYMSDTCGDFRATWFNNRQIKNIEMETQLRVYGKIDRSFKDTVQINVQDYEMLEEGQTVQGIIPVYPATANLTQSIIRNAINDALKHLNDLQEPLPSDLLKRHTLPGIQQCINDLHKPNSMDDIAKAKYRLAFEELFLLQLALLKRKNQLTSKLKPFKYHGNGRLIKGYLKSLPFTPTMAQFRCWKEICADMNAPTPMARLVLGDVGSGKTLLAALALLKAVESNFQGAMMVPTEILARQHYKSLQEWFEPLGVEVELLVSGASKDVRDRIGNGEANIIVGTHALIQEDVKYHKLATVVVDEQHRFGVEQRTQLQQKGERPDVLVMTATPIPRTLAMTVYGDLDLSIIDEYPAGRLQVKTYYAPPEKKPGVYDFLRKELDKGRQAYIVCPLVEDSEAIEAQSAESLFEEITTGELRNYKVGLVHGRMKQAEKEAVMNSFIKGDLQVLISTTVIEVGVNVPNASIILINDADRFGIAQLHQLRGRVGRGEHQSYCVLVSQPKNEITVARLRAMCHTTDGFKLSEEDLRLRGPGELFGSKQSGLPDLKVADLWGDQELIALAREEAQKYVDSSSLDNTVNERFSVSALKI